jgi:hypothetical protein
MIDRCYEKIDDTYAYICLRWKAWLLLTIWDDVKAYQYLKRLVKRYPKSFIFETLWDIAYNMWNIDEAKKRFIQWLSATDDNDLRQEMLHKVRSTILQSK